MMGSRKRNPAVGEASEGEPPGVFTRSDPRTGVFLLLSAPNIAVEQRPQTSFPAKT